MLPLLKIRPVALALPVFLATALATGWSSSAVASQSIEKTGQLCTQAIRTQEKRSGIPNRLLEAIASVESGRWNRETGVNIAWPWTVTAEGAGKFYPSRRAAIAAVEALQRRGIRNIDVGCMQINLGYHPDAFRSLNHAFDPSTNVAYAAKFLKELRIQRRSWDKAMRYYHSSDPKRQRYYGDKVYKARHAIRLRDAKERRNTRVALAKTRQANQPSVRNPKVNEVVRGVPLSSWPPRSYRAQRQLENRARNWAFNKRRH
ncbi:MAG: transglycosylase SLT domain-containing protein [Rhodospirillaceae bacterium]|nr:transglycosylase SLT domain-containing protein [Rhodospirillaceae bacterium]MDD9914354.1 transglycosylase SLT domain-containing protein [Rhodospirillaceae bacterium]